MAQGGFAHINTGGQFLSEGFTEKDLVICPELTTRDVSIGWMREVLKWNPKAAADEPGAWMKDTVSCLSFSSLFQLCARY